MEGRAVASVDVIDALRRAAHLQSTVATLLLVHGYNDSRTALHGSEEAAIGELPVQGATTTMQVGHAGLSVTVGGGSSDRCVVAVLVEPSSGTEQGSGAVTLASSLVDVRLVNVVDGSAMLREDVHFNVELPMDTPITGTGRCQTNGPWDEPAPLNQTCVAGCCVNGECACRLGYTGPLCDQELRCAMIRPGQSSFGLGDQCATHENDGGQLVCSCSEVGMVGILKLRYTPPTNTLSWEQLIELAPMSYASSKSRLLWCVTFVLPGVLLSCVYLARFVDARNLHFDQRSHHLPFFLQPRRHPFVTQLLGIVATRSSVLRIFFTYASHTPYSHAQLSLVFATTIAVNATAVGLFLGISLGCSIAGVFFSFIATCLAGICASVGRLLFRWANLCQTTRNRLYSANKAARRLAQYPGLTETQRRVHAIIPRRQRVMPILKKFQGKDADSFASVNTLVSADLGGVSTVSSHQMGQIGQLSAQLSPPHLPSQLPLYPPLSSAPPSPPDAQPPTIQESRSSLPVSALPSVATPGDAVPVTSDRAASGGHQIPKYAGSRT